MAHPHDINCKWCGAELWRITRAARVFVHTECPLKPTTTWQEGAAAWEALRSMAEAIRARYWDACDEPGCNEPGPSFYCRAHYQTQIDALRASLERATNAMLDSAGVDLGINTAKKS